METLERSRVCRLCGKQAGMTIDIFSKRGNYMKKINLVLPILVHEMDLLPKHMCHPCNCKLQEFHKFYEDCLKTDADLKSQLSWMQGSAVREDIIAPMVQINNVKIKTEPLDYDEQEITEAVLNNEKLANYEDNNYATFRERIVQLSGTQYSRCGCYCGNRKSANDDSHRNQSKIRSNKNKQKNGEKNDPEYPSRDMIRRNLFATEIFGNKNSTVQSEIPICNLSRRYFNERPPSGVESRTTALNRLCDEQNGADVEAKIEMADVLMKIAPQETRTLRPRKGFVTTNLTGSQRSASDGSKKSSNKAMTSKRITRGSKGGSDSSTHVGIKMEAPDDFERSLRPRTETIDYSESGRKNPLARARESEERVKKFKVSPDDSKRDKLKIEIDKDSMPLVEKFNNLKSPAFSSVLVVKLERQDFTRCAKTTSVRKTKKVVKKPFVLLKNNGGTTPVVVKEEIVNGGIIAGIACDDNIKTFTGTHSSLGRINNKMANSPRRRNLHKNIRTSTLCLRSQIGCLKSGKLLRKLDFIVDDEPKRAKRRNSSRFS